MAAGETPKRRGRPRLSPDPDAPPEAWLDGLSPTALHVVAAARDLLIAEGFEALTTERVAFEAGVDPSTVKRLFVSRAGLVLAVLDRIQMDAWNMIVESLEPIADPRERRDLYLRRQGELIADRAAEAGVEAVVHGLRDPIVRQKIAIMYDVWRDATLRTTELDGVADPEETARRRTLVSLVLAVYDGLALQRAADPSAVDVDAACAMLADMVRLLIVDRAAP
jgi:AcrR family transcriptional regulator